MAVADDIRLEQLFRRLFPGLRPIVVSNREPYEHKWAGEPDQSGDVEVAVPAGGLISSLDPLLQALGGTWIAWGSGEADRAVVDENDSVLVPPGNPSYRLRRVWLSHHDVHRYYLGYANQFLWPLCHLRPDLSRVRGRYWERYCGVNQMFAEAVLDEVGDGSAAVWFHDYHLALAPRYVRERRPDLKLAHFWHIPWPPLEIFSIAPNGADLVEGLLANDLLGFHLPGFVESFLRCAEALTAAEVDRETGRVTLNAHTCQVGAFPISIDVGSFREAASVSGVEQQMSRIRQRYAPPGSAIGLGVDRLDYSKGLPEKLKALDFLWERNPELRETLTFIQIAVPSRSDIEAYEDLAQKVEKQVWEINERYGTEDWQPVHLVKASLSSERLAVYYRLADFCLVNSLQDGMNLVAKEYVASQVDRNGVLLLSRFAGAAEELKDAVLVNPYDPEQTAVAIRDALAMSAEERRQRMEALQGSLRTIFDWMADVFTAWEEAAVHSTA